MGSVLSMKTHLSPWADFNVWTTPFLIMISPSSGPYSLTFESRDICIWPSTMRRISSWVSCQCAGTSRISASGPPVTITLVRYLSFLRKVYVVMLSSICQKNRIKSTLTIDNPFPVLTVAGNCSSDITRTRIVRDTVKEPLLWALKFVWLYIGCSIDLARSGVY